MSSPITIHKIDWEKLIPPEQWAVYGRLLDRASIEGLEFALGGGLAVGLYTGWPRNTKDLDIYIRRQDRDLVISMMSSCGLEDLHDKQPYDRAWIYRGNRDDVIVDAIWAMANKRAEVDGTWIARGVPIYMFDRQLPMLAPEELIWSKLYVLQRDRCDWPDVLNLIYATGPYLDWAHLLDRVAEDQPLLKGVLSIFSWVSPGKAMAIPRRVWESLGLQMPKVEHDPEGRPARPDLLDSRPWFGEQVFCEQVIQPAA